MALVKSTGFLVLAIVGITLLRQVCSQHVYVAAPNTFRIGEKEKVAVYSHSGVQEVTVSLADCPGKKKVFFSEALKVVTDQPKILEVKVDPEHIPDLNITGPLEPHYVFLMVKGKTFTKETKVLVTLQSGYVFIQTDKPIYNPTQPVNIRVMRLNENMVSDQTPFTLQIRNPQNTIVHSLPHKELENKRGMYSTVFNFPNYPLYGEWSVTILYGLKAQLNSTVKFELRKYVLPTFEVDVKVPEVILPDDTLVPVSLNAEYVYGKKVDGRASIKLKVKIPTGQTQQFGSCDAVELFEGKAECNFHTKDIKEKKLIGWFPGISGAKLVVEALVFERSSGYKENGTTDYTIFSPSPYVISFGKSLTTYIAGLDTAMLAQVNHVNGNPARGVQASITVTDQSNNVVAVETPNGVTNDEGIVAFVVKTKSAYSSLKITVEAKDKKHSVSGHLTMSPYKAINNAYVGISRDSILVRKVGDSFTPSVYGHPVPDIPMSYLVVSKGKIVTAGSLLQKGRHQRSLNFKITADMVPSARIVLFATYGNQLLSDSVKIIVEKVCNPKGEVKVEVTSKNNIEPGSSVDVKISGKENTVVGILAVDKAVYALRNKDKLTREKMFSEMEKHDMGCGPGGGPDSAAVLANAGIILISDTLSLSQERKSCVERKLRKRAIREEITRQHGKTNKRCCEAGQRNDIHARSCEVRADIIRRFEGKLNNKEQCAEEFLTCCLKALSPLAFPISVKNEKPAFAIHGRSKGNEPADIDVEDDEFFEELLENTRERKDFKETWLFEVDVIGSSGVLSQPRNLPDSITTWIVQVVALSSNGGGMCVAEPVKVVAFKNFFLDVKVPHSVVRNEQIEIPVTVFNYGSQTRSVFVFTYGVDGICSEAQPGQRGDRKKIVVRNNSAETVAFQMIPLEAKEFPIKFSAISSGGTDTVLKMLNVIPEGVSHEEFIPFAIDPSNTEKRKRRNIVHEKYEARFDNENKKQLSIVKLQPEFEFIVPGTEYAVIEAIGDKFGPTIHTSLENPDSLLRLPHGCGEQNMAFTAPTVYTLHYLKATGKLTPEQETKAYKFMREGYNKQQTYRKPDGSFTVWPTHPSSTWLTTFVARVFCQAGRYIFIDENVICGALRWLVTKQKPDGSFVESYNLHHKEMKGGITGDVPLTSFVVMAFSQCHCKSQDLNKPIEKAVKYLTEKSAIINDHYSMAISTYALALYDIQLAKEPNEKLLRMSSFDPALNRRHWGDGKSALSVEASSYGLLTQVLFSDLDKSTSIVNFLNSQRKIGGSFWSTQDTVAAIEALSEYAILTKDPDISLVMNISSTTDPSFQKMWQFQNNNARVRRQAELTKLGGRLVVEATGSGVGLFGVRLRYNIANSPDRPALCQFNVSVDVAVAKEKIAKENKPQPAGDDDFNDLLNELGVDEPPKNKENLGRVGGNFERRFGNLKPEKEYNIGDIVSDDHILNRDDIEDEPRLIFKRQAPDLVVEAEGRLGIAPKSSKYVLNVTICSRYLKDKETNMAIVDVGMLTGFKPNIQDLKDLVGDSSSLVDRFEESGRNLIFYMEKIPQDKDHCFWFRIIREFIASNLESGLVRVYDYYNPDEACSQFYRSESMGPALSVNCVGSVCKCAEGGCPKEPVERIRNAPSTALKRREITKMACNEHDYFFKVEVMKKKSENSGYIHYDMKIVKVLKEGREKRDDVETEIRKFVARSNCATSDLSLNRIYYLMGRDQEPRQVGDEVTYIYFIDQSSTVQEFIDTRRKDKKYTIKQKNVQHIFGFVEKLFNSDEGCDD